MRQKSLTNDTSYTHMAILIKQITGLQTTLSKNNDAVNITITSEGQCANLSENDLVAQPRQLITPEMAMRWELRLTCFMQMQAS